MRIRKARQRDLSALVQIERLGTELYYRTGFFRTDLIPRTTGDLRFLLAHSTMMVAADSGDRPVGYISYYPIKPYLHLEEHAVHPDFHREGIGEVLLNHYLAAGREMAGMEHFSLLCFQEAFWAYRLYSKHRFAAPEPWQMESLKTNVFQRILTSEARQLYPRQRVLMIRDRE